MSAGHDDFAFEPVPGLPARLPAGETMLWQGAPEWQSLARSAFHVVKVTAYFAVLMVWQVGKAISGGADAAQAIAGSLWLVPVAAAAVAILSLLAWLYARGTVYTLTSKRIVIRSGLALPVTLNLPLSLIETASMRTEGGGKNSIAMTVTAPNRVAFLVLWPNARPWHFTNPQPMLRCLGDADAVAPKLAEALRADAGMARATTDIRMPEMATGGHGVPAAA